MHIPLLSPLLLFPLDSLHALSAQFLYGLLAPTGFFSAPSSIPSTSNGQYLLGLGIADITGPVVETNMMGYASLPQTDTGLHMRQRARAFIVAETSPSGQRVVLLNADIAMGDSGVRHLLSQVTSKGLHPQTPKAIVDGAVLAVRRAHESLAPGTLSFGTGRVEGGSRNRSPTAYLANPAAERAKDTDRGGEDVDQHGPDNTLDGRGFLSFFTAHGTSLYENNTLISGDNKGMAAYLYEASIEPHAIPGNNTYVAGFVQDAVGDTSPNTRSNIRGLGVFCESPGKPYDGLPCVTNSSTCGGGYAHDCRGRGPAFTADATASGVMSLSAPSKRMQTRVKTCPAAMGFSFAGGTT
ncbi:Neutral/alkaline non-lysosomal ceramidase-domain-containing protein [Mycena metata]|uniref:Neutral ceramidase n=1 Tax=Mycena metata TaxID=1033252 RepID=A0AAD7K064_9AGAR|nr:Neutral/alkaline non-lysosomal ceramidase-domain-containing protein [Mycena metata]